MPRAPARPHARAHRPSPPVALTATPPSSRTRLPRTPPHPAPLPPARTLQARRYDSQTTTFSPEGARPSRTARSRAPTLMRAGTAAVRRAARPTPPRPTRRSPRARVCAGRLYQVEYAIAAIQNAAAAVGLQTKGGIVIATEKRVASKLLAPSKTSEKVYKIDEHVGAPPQSRRRAGAAARREPLPPTHRHRPALPPATPARRAGVHRGGGLDVGRQHPCAVRAARGAALPVRGVGLAACRAGGAHTRRVAPATAAARRHVRPASAAPCAPLFPPSRPHCRYTYGEEQPVEQLVTLLCDYKHGYTQYGGLRPFGVSFLYAGWDRHFGFQMYQSDPSGNYSGWKATAIGSNSQSAQSTLKSDYTEELSLTDATKLAVRVLGKAMDTTNPTAEKMEVRSGVG